MKFAIKAACMIKRPQEAIDQTHGYPATLAEAKARQSLKIKALRVALIRAGIITLNEQARALRLSRSTTWAVLRGDHKASGLSASIISRMLSSPELPAIVRSQILDYVTEKAAGAYGHTE